MVRNYLVLYAFFIATLSSTVAAASSCCGQSGGSFPVSYLNQKWFLNFGLSESEVLGRVRGKSRQFVTFSDDKELLKNSFSFELVFSPKSRHQVFLKNTLFRNSYESAVLNQQKTDLSDLVLGYTFEAFPEYSYSNWKPVVYLSAFLNLPTGRSVHDPEGLAEGIDVTGYDQWGLGAGVTLRKVWFPFRAIFQMKSLALFADNLSDVRLSSFWEHALSLTLGYSLTNFYDLNIVSGLSWQGLQGRIVDSVQTEDSEFVSMNISLIKPLSDTLALSLSYVDQTLLGTPENTLLNRAASINFNYSFF